MHLPLGFMWMVWQVKRMLLSCVCWHMKEKKQNISPGQEEVMTNRDLEVANFVEVRMLICVIETRILLWASPEIPSKVQSIDEALVCKLTMRWVIYGHTLWVLFSVKNFLSSREKRQQFVWCSSRGLCIWSHILRDTLWKPYYVSLSLVWSWFQPEIG